MTILDGKKISNDIKDEIAEEVKKMKPLEKLAVYETGLVPDLERLSGSQPKSARKHVRIAMHPGSGSPMKNWPTERWSELIEHYSNTSNLEILVVGSVG